MKLSVTVVDRRATHRKAAPYASTPVEYEDYDRVSIKDAIGPGPVLAGILRAVADEIDPQAEQPASKVEWIGSEA